MALFKGSVNASIDFDEIRVSAAGVTLYRKGERMVTLTHPPSGDEFRFTLRSVHHFELTAEAA
jgi:hypothetical protein